VLLVGTLLWPALVRADSKPAKPLAGRVDDVATDVRDLGAQAHELVQHQAKRLGTTFSDVWNFELVAIEGQPLTVKNVVLALVMVTLGFLLSGFLSRVVGRGVRRRLKVADAAAATVESIVFYVFLAWFILFALRLVSFPMTVFTVIGGALAIGIGFGSQNVMNNFISGLLLLIERPVKVGDLIQINGTFGHVERIGGRSTRVRTSVNTHVIVPNSTFLETNVLNWTLSDDLVRTSVSVGIVYGSPTREAARLIEQALTEHGRVLKEPAWTILFTEFGDNSLNFEAHFWVHSKQILDMRRIESDIRYRIDDLFREAGIVIAFPQRDVHLDTVRPIEVRLMDRS
jgi:potassium efflux system protein